MAKLTLRMKNWLEGTGAHIGTATPDGIPTVVVVDKAKTSGDAEVRFALSVAQIEQIQQNIARNPQVAFGPGSIGSIRAAYQFKGQARIEAQELVVAVDEIYSTKPGPEAGLRLDNLPFESIEQFEKTRWRDSGPPR